MKKIQTTRARKLDCKKLHLIQETVRQLRGADLEIAAGGYLHAPSLDCESVTLACG
jgi:hypothetical protein